MKKSVLLAAAILFVFILLLTHPIVAEEDCGCGLPDSPDPPDPSPHDDSGSTGGDSSGTDSPSDSGSSESSDSGGGASSGSDGSIYDAVALTTQARTLFSAGMYNESLEAYNRSLRMDPSSKSSWMGKGEALFRMERYTEAYAAFQRVVKLDPSEEAAYFWMGNSQLRSGDFQGAIASYDRALAINPRYAEAEQNRTLAKQEISRAESAPTPVPALTVQQAAEVIPPTNLAETPGQSSPTPSPTPTQTPFLYSGAMGSIACLLSLLVGLFIGRKR